MAITCGYPVVMLITVFVLGRTSGSPGRRDRRPESPARRLPRCAALCCVAPAFAASADFALDKPAGTPCPKLGGDLGCGIHADLRERGFAGCAVFDCFGAGQQVVQDTFGGRTGATSPEAAARDVRRLPGASGSCTSCCWYLAEALARCPARARCASEVRTALRAPTERLAGASSADDARRLRRGGAPRARSGRCCERVSERRARGARAAATGAAPTSSARGLRRARPARRRPARRAT